MVIRRTFLRGVTAGLGLTSQLGGKLAALAVSPAQPALVEAKHADTNATVAQVLADARRAGRSFPGMIAAFVRAERLLGISATGVRKLGSPDLVEVGDLVHLGSCGKAMTATMLASVVESGQLRWDSTFATVFPTDLDSMHVDYRGVTLDQLLHHTAGLPANVDYSKYADTSSTTLGRRGILTSELHGPPRNTPGQTFEYSNVGYCLAALMAEQVLATSWEDLMRQRVFEPLGITSAGFGPPGSRDAITQPWGHRALGPLFLPTWGDNPPVMGPAGTIHVTVADWAKFASFHLGDGTAPGGKRLLTAESMANLHTPRPGEHYAGGWLVSAGKPWSAGPLLDHTGSNTMWLAYLVLAPGLKVAAMAACNGGGSHAETACVAVVNDLIKLEPTLRG